MSPMSIATAQWEVEVNVDMGQGQRRQWCCSLGLHPQNIASSWSHWAKAEATEPNSSLISYFKDVYMALQTSISTPVSSLWTPKCLPFKLYLKFHSTIIYNLRAEFRCTDRPTRGLWNLGWVLQWYLLPVCYCRGMTASVRWQTHLLHSISL